MEILDTHSIHSVAINITNELQRDKRVANVRTTV